MKIAMIGLRGIPAQSGGVEAVVEQLAPLLVKRGAEVTVYCRTPYCPDRLKEYKGVKLKYLPTINTKFTETIVHSTLSTGDAMFKDYDIVHFHAMGNALFTIFPRISGKKTVLTLHGLDWQREKWGMAAKVFIRFSESMSVILASRIISVSSKIQKYFKSQYGKDIDFIANGIAPQKQEKIELLSRFGLKKGKYILFLGRLVPEKGAHYLIEAFKTLKTDQKLAIVGDATHTDKYVSDLKALAQDDKRIIFTGALYGKEKAAAFSNATLFVLPSTIEGMPIALLEAMSYGTCPLVSDIEENIDVIGKNAPSFKSKSSADLAKQLSFWLSKPKKVKATGAACKKLVEKEYKWELIADKHMKLYEEVLGGRKL